jgi:hypothetical protein
VMRTAPKALLAKVRVLVICLRIRRTAAVAAAEKATGRPGMRQTPPGSNPYLAR